MLIKRHLFLNKANFEECLEIRISENHLKGSNYGAKAKPHQNSFTNNFIIKLSHAR